MQPYLCSTSAHQTKPPFLPNQPSALLLINLQLIRFLHINLHLLALDPPIQIPHIIRRRLKMARRIITPTNIHSIPIPTLQRLVNRDWRANEALFDFAETLQTGLKLEVVVGFGFGDGGDDGNIVAFGADVVRGGDDGDVDV